MGNLSERDKKLLLGGLAVVILLLAFKFGFQNINSKADSVKDEVMTLKTEYDKLYSMYTKEKFYKTEIKKDTAVYEELLTKYPANYTQEFQLMFLDSLERGSNWISVYNVAHPDKETSQTLSSTTGILGCESPITVNFQANYNDVLEFIKNLRDNKYKTKIDNIALTYNASDASVSGTANISLFSVIGGDRKPEVVNTTSVLIGREDVSIFDSKTFSPNMSKADETDSTRIRNDNDLYVLVSPWGSTQDNVIVGFSKDNTGKNNISANGNVKQKVSITITGANGIYQAAYKVGDQSVQATEFVAGESIDILISSANRPDDVDLVGADVTINNNTTDQKAVNFTIINDDKTHGRITVNPVGNVVAY